MTAPGTTRAAGATCPRCARPATGRFCAECGAALGDAPCAGCATKLSPGARFCHRCGLPAGGSAPAPAHAAGSRGLSSALPWAVAGIALLALVALVAGQRFGGGGDAATPAFAGAPPVSAGDISQLSPREAADRLFDRVMRLHSEGKADSAQFFGLMAFQVYRSMPALDLDLRYDMGRIAEVTGALDVARAQADTILAEQPTHLLGLLLAARTAREMGDDAAARGFERRLLEAESRELERDLIEYQRHRNDILTALAEARRRG